MNLRDKLRNSAPDELESTIDAEPAAAPKKRIVKKKAAPQAAAPKAKSGALPKLDVNRRFLLLAGLVAGIAAIMAANYLNSAGAGLSEGGTKIAVLVAASDIEPGTKLTEDLYTTKEIPKAYLPTGYYEKPEDLVDRLAIAPMVAGEPIIEKRTSQPSPKYGIAYLLKSGERAKTISVDSASGLAGLIKPGNEVDLIATIPDPRDSDRRIGTPILQKARVIAAGNRLLGEVRTPEEEEAYGSDSGVSSEGTITLAIPATKIGVVTLLEDLGNLKMVLRAVGDNAVAKTTYSDEQIMTLVSGKELAKPAPVAPRPQPVSENPRPVTRPWRPAPRPVAVEQPVARPRPVAPRPRPTARPVNTEVIQFGGSGE